MAFLDNSGLAYFWNKIKSEISSESCIVCSPNQPENLKKGLWIETDSSDKDINIVDSCDDLLTIKLDSCKKATATLEKSLEKTTSASVENKCYIFGGSYQEDTNGRISNYSYYRIQIYDTETNVRTTASATVSEPGDISACSVETKCYIFGGLNSNKIQIYDTETDVKTVSGSTLSGNFYGVSVASIGNKCYIFGGYVSGASHDYIQIYDTETDTITLSAAVLSENISGTSASPVGCKCYILGGNKNYIQIYDTETDIVTISNATLNSSIKDTATASIGSKCYIFGGYTGNYISTIQIYDTETDVATISNATLVSGASSISASSVGCRCYIFGGRMSNRVSQSNYIQIFSPYYAKANNNHFSDSILITLKNDNDKQIANKIALSVQGKGYSYKPVENVYYVDSDDIVSELTYHKIENNQTV